jgi:hypothetical protein
MAKSIRRQENPFRFVSNLSRSHILYYLKGGLRVLLLLLLWKMTLESVLIKNSFSQKKKKSFFEGNKGHISVSLPEK